MCVLTLDDERDSDKASADTRHITLSTARVQLGDAFPTSVLFGDSDTKPIKSTKTGVKGVFSSKWLSEPQVGIRGILKSAHLPSIATSSPEQNSKRPPPHGALSEKWERVKSRIGDSVSGNKQPQPSCHLFANSSHTKQVTVQNVCHILFGMAALGGSSAGAVSGLREICFAHVRTVNTHTLANRMHVVEQSVPESFYLE